MIPKWFNHLTRFATRPQTLQRDEIGGVGFWAVNKTRLVSIPYTENQRILYFEKDDAQQVFQHSAKQMTSLDGWKKHLYEYKKRSKDLLQAAKKASSGKLTIEIFNQWIDAIKSYAPYFISPFSVEKVIQPECVSLLRKELGQEAEHAFEIISSPSRLHAYQKMRLDILEAVISKTKSYGTYKKLAKKWGWYNEYSFIEPLLTPQDFRKEIEKINLEDVKSEKQKIIHEINRNRVAYRALQHGLKNQRLKLLAEIIHAYTFLRTDRIDIFKKAQAQFRVYYDALAESLTKKTGNIWSREEVVQLLNNEIIAFIKKRIIPDRELINKRIKQEYVYYHENEKSHVIHNKNEIKIICKKVEKSTNSEIKGSIAFKGKTRGGVCIIYSKADLPKIKEGEILVTRTTMPDYAQAMKRSGAIVTEEGGITSHAAIVSRELKKPCIVGTGNCTKLLKDGDYVEVDANKGIVKILKRV